MTKSEPRRALVLGGGGVLGVAWLLGALAAIEAEAGFDVRCADTVIGTSAGSVAAALLGCGLGVDVLCRHHQGIADPDDPQVAYDHQAGIGAALPPRPGWRPSSPRVTWEGLRHPRQVSPLVALSGLLPPGRASLLPVHDLVDGVARAAGFGVNWPDRPRPWIVATDYRRGRRVVFGRDESLDASPVSPLADAVEASCSIPGWYPPKYIGGVPYIDGGTVSIASVDLLHETDVDEAYVLAPMASIELDRPDSRAEKFERRIRRVVTRRILAEVARLRSSGTRVVLLTPGVADLQAMGANMMDPSRRTEVLQTARTTAVDQLRVQLAGAGRHNADLRNVTVVAGGEQR